MRPGGWADGEENYGDAERPVDELEDVIHPEQQHLGDDPTNEGDAETDGGPPCHCVRRAIPYKTRNDPIPRTANRMRPGTK